MDSVALGAQLLLAIVFATAGIGKLRDRPGSRTALTEFGVPERLAPAGAVLLPLAELCVAVALLVHQSARWGAIAALLLLLAFIGGIARALARGEAPDCHCFGQIHSAPAGRETLARNGLLAVLAGIVAVHGAGPAYDDWVNARDGTELAAIGLGVLATVLAAIAVRLWLDRRDLRRELARAQEAVALFPAGLPVGATAPEFALRDLAGHERSLASLLAPDLPVALIFVSPSCGPCAALLSDVGRWQESLEDRLTIGLVSSGSSLENQIAKDKHDLRNLLLQEDAEVMEAYRVEGTPAAVMLTAEGRIASVAVEGVYAIEPLIRLTLRGGADAHPPAEWPEEATNGAGVEQQPSG